MYKSELCTQIMNAAEQEAKYVHGGKFQLQFPLVSKIKGKKKVWIKNSNSVVNGLDDEDECIPLTRTIHENQSNGSLLDRIASLEDRILQLCSEIESYKKSSPGSLMNRDKFSGASSSSGSKIERMCSYPAFDIPNPQTRRLPRVSFSDNLVFQGNTNRVQQQQQGQQIKISSSMKQKRKQKLLGKKRDRKTTTSSNGKKNISQSWPYLKMLGC